MRNKLIYSCMIIAASSIFVTGCKKLLEIAPPINTLTTQELFSSNKQAEWAIASIYSKMITGYEDYLFMNELPDKIFSSGLSTILGGLSADELTVLPELSASDAFVAQNKLTLINSGKTAGIWNSAYKTIYDANAAIEGLEAAVSLTDSVKKQLLGEALAIRAFSYFYLVNFFGDVPLVVSTAFKKTQNYPRSPVSTIYDQIKADLIRAKPFLSADFSVGNNERVRINRWFAEAMLARVYLYTKEYPLAASSATEVINQSGMFGIEQDPINVFRPNSKEAIFQLKPTDQDMTLGNSTPEALRLYNVPAPGDTYYRVCEISNQLLASFEPNDARKNSWIHSAIPGHFIAAKYILHQRQYYTVMRLAELHLIRAEAIVQQSPAAKNDAIDDLNILRRRAGVLELDDQLSAEQVIAAIAKERRNELFVEWGHRWFDLKRTGKANEVLSGMASKQPWWGDYQLLYPIPPTEIVLNGNLQQNPEYNFR